MAYHRPRRRGNRGKKNLIWYERYGPVPLVPCCWCGRPLKFSEATLEHVTPLGLGGRDHPDNWDIACWRCNQREGKWVSRFCNKKKKRQVEEMSWWGRILMKAYGFLSSH